MSTYFDSPVQIIPDDPMAAQWVADAYLGPPFCGFMAHFILYGILINQFQSYLSSHNHRKDSRFNQTFIWLVVALDSIHTAINIWEVWYHATSQDRTAQAVFMTTVPDALPPMLVGSIGFLVQSYLSVRASKLFARRRVVRGVFLGIVFTMMAVAWVASIGAGVANLSYTYGFQDSMGKFTYNAIAGTWLWLAAGVDLIVTATLIFGMRAHVHGFNKSTDGAIKQMIKVAMLTASFTSLFGVIGALFATVFPQTQVTTANALFSVDLPLSSLYALSLLTTLNCRKRVQRLRGVTTTALFDRPSPAPQPKEKTTPALSFSRTLGRLRSASLGTDREKERDVGKASLGEGVRVLVETSQEVDEDRTVHGVKRRATLVPGGGRGGRFLAVPGLVGAGPGRRGSVAFGAGGGLVELTALGIEGRA